MKNDILRKHNFVAKLTCKGQDMVLEEKVKISEVCEFSILPYTQNRKLRNLGQLSFTSNFEMSCNLDAKTTKN